VPRQFQVLIELDRIENVWVTYVPALNMLSTYGHTREEALAKTEEAIQGYLEIAAQESIPIPDTPSSVE
jgi:predicted RNase H-like HicB family nuclease